MKTEPPPYGRGQWSNGRIPLPTALIPAAANREAAGPVVVDAGNAAVAVVQAAVPGIGPGEDGGGPPKSAAGHGEETSVNGPIAARQGRET